MQFVKHLWREKAYHDCRRAAFRIVTPPMIASRYSGGDRVFYLPPLQSPAEGFTMENRMECAQKTERL